MKNKGKGKSKKHGKAQKQPQTSNPSSINLDTDTRIPNEEADDELVKLEEELTAKVDCFYEDVLKELVSLGYDKDIARTSIILNGHPFNGPTLFNNIMTNTIWFINGGELDQRCHFLRHFPISWEDRVIDLKAFLIHLIERNRTDMSRCELLKYLTGSQLRFDPPSSYRSSSRSNVKLSDTPEVRLGFALNPVSKQEILDTPEIPPDDAQESNTGSSSSNNSTNNNVWTFNLTPTLEDRLCENVSKLVANIREENGESSCLLDSLPIREISEPTAQVAKTVDRAISEVEDWLMENPNLKNSLSLNMLNYIRYLRERVKQRREWADKKVLQAAQTVSTTILELNLLRLLKGKSNDATIDAGKDEEDECLNLKMISDREDAINQAKLELEYHNDKLRMLERENAAIRAEIKMRDMEATEYNAKKNESEKQAKKYEKKLMNLEKECVKLQEQILEGHNMKIRMQEESVEVKKATPQIEAEANEEMNQVKLMGTLVLEENKLTRNIEADIRTNQAALRRKLERECNVMKDDKRRLQEELSNLLKTSSHQLSKGTSETIASSSSSSNIDINSIILSLDEKACLQVSSKKLDFRGRICKICSNKEALVLFLPCCHQVACLDCNKTCDFGGMCPYCKVPTEETICVFSACK